MADKRFDLPDNEFLLMCLSCKITENFKFLIFFLENSISETKKRVFISEIFPWKECSPLAFRFTSLKTEGNRKIIKQKTNLLPRTQLRLFFFWVAILISDYSHNKSRSNNFDCLCTDSFKYLLDLFLIFCSIFTTVLRNNTKVQNLQLFSNCFFPRAGLFSFCAAINCFL